MGNDSQRVESQGFDQLRDVEDELVDHVVAPDRPGAVAVPPEVGRDHVVLLSQFPGDPIPAARMILVAMNEQ